MDGVRANLARLTEMRMKTDPLTRARSREEVPLGSAIGLMIRERLTGEAPDPLIACAYAAARTTRLKFGTSVLVLPGRNPVVLAKEMASLDRLSGGRFLPAVGLGAPVPVEHRAFGIDRKERAGWFDEALGLMRRLWTEDHVTHDGQRFHVEDVTIEPKPVGGPVPFWYCGATPASSRRAVEYC